MSGSLFGTSGFDPSRTGGFGGGMGMMQRQAQRPQAAPASMPKAVWRPAIAQAPGQPPAPRPERAPVSEGQEADIQSIADAMMEVLRTETEVVTVELDWVSPAAVRAEPEAATKIPGIEDLTPRQIRTQAILDARQLLAIASRALQGALGAHLSPEQRISLEEIQKDLEAIIQVAQNYDLDPIPETKYAQAERHAATHTAAAKGLLDKAERAVVAAEAAGIPVREPSERGIGPLATLVGVGIVAAVVWAIVELA